MRTSSDVKISSISEGTKSEPKTANKIDEIDKNLTFGHEWEDVNQTTDNASAGLKQRERNSERERNGARNGARNRARNRARLM